VLRFALFFIAKEKVMPRKSVIATAATATCFTLFWIYVQIRVKTV